MCERDRGHPPPAGSLAGRLARRGTTNRAGHAGRRALEDELERAFAASFCPKRVVRSAIRLMISRARLLGAASRARRGRNPCGSARARAVARPRAELARRACAHRCARTGRCMCTGCLAREHMRTSVQRLQSRQVSLGRLEQAAERRANGRAIERGDRVVEGALCLTRSRRSRPVLAHAGRTPPGGSARMSRIASFRTAVPARQRVHSAPQVDLVALFVAALSHCRRTPSRAVFTPRRGRLRQLPCLVGVDQAVGASAFALKLPSLRLSPVDRRSIRSRHRVSLQPVPLGRAHLLLRPPRCRPACAFPGLAFAQLLVLSTRSSPPASRRSGFRAGLASAAERAPAIISERGTAARRATERSTLDEANGQGRHDSTARAWSRLSRRSVNAERGVEGFFVAPPSSPRRSPGSPPHGAHQVKADHPFARVVATAYQVPSGCPECVAQALKSLL